MQENIENKGLEEPDDIKVPDFKGARCILMCPAIDCTKKIPGGRCKLPRMIQHIDKQHSGLESLKVELDRSYPPKKIVHVNGLKCKICNEFIAGNSFHLKRHIQRKH